MIAGRPTLAAIRSFSMHDSHRPLSRRLDRCDRFIQKESGDFIRGDVYF